MLKTSQPARRPHKDIRKAFLRQIRTLGVELFAVSEVGDNGDIHYHAVAYGNVDKDSIKAAWDEACGQETVVDCRPARQTTRAETAYMFKQHRGSQTRLHRRGTPPITWQTLNFWGLSKAKFTAEADKETAAWFETPEGLEWADQRERERAFETAESLDDFFRQNNPPLLLTGNYAVTPCDIQPPATPSHPAPIEPPTPSATIADEARTDVDSTPIGHDRTQWDTMGDEARDEAGTSGGLISASDAKQDKFTGSPALRAGLFRFSGTLDARTNPQQTPTGSNFVPMGWKSDEETIAAFAEARTRLGVVPKCSAPTTTTPIRSDSP